MIDTLKVGQWFRHIADQDDYHRVARTIGPNVFRIIAYHKTWVTSERYEWNWWYYDLDLMKASDSEWLSKYLTPITDEAKMTMLAFSMLHTKCAMGVDDDFDFN